MWVSVCVCVCNIFKSAHGADEAGALAERLKGNKSNADKQKIDSFDLGVRIKKVTRKAKWLCECVCVCAR